VASLRDVFQHAGKPVQLWRDGSLRAEGKAMQRGETMLLESKLEPRADDEVRPLGGSERWRILNADPQVHDAKIDHYRCTVEPVRG
jgi:hypothetical protein